MFSSIIEAYTHPPGARHASSTGIKQLPLRLPIFSHHMSNCRKSIPSFQLLAFCHNSILQGQSQPFPPSQVPAPSSQPSHRHDTRLPSLPGGWRNSQPPRLHYFQTLSILRPSLARTRIFSKIDGKRKIIGGGKRLWDGEERLVSLNMVFVLNSTAVAEAHRHSPA